jgi:L-ascorbate metabolism protein UlaG (beta-lactamase superfamily)
LPDASLKWLGHASFRLDSVEGKRIYVDPFLQGPTCPDDERDPERVDMILLTHGHGDHLGSTIELWQKHKPRVIAPVELRDRLEMHHGVEGGAGNDPNKGGTVDADGIKVTLTNAHHSSSDDSGAYTGEPVGFVVEVENGRKVYFAGDTCVFGDMQLIRRLYSPDVAVLPIGGHYTMDPKEAALAIELLGVNRVVPCHYGTFPILKGTPAELKELAPGVEVYDIEPGASISL